MMFTSTSRESIDKYGDPHPYRLDLGAVRPEDPRPWVSHAGRFVNYKSDMVVWPRSFDPRPEYRAPANPILVAFRANRDAGSSVEARHVLRDFYHFVIDEAPDALPEHIEHARKVLSRLAVLA